jgi:hypothetical protein
MLSRFAKAVAPPGGNAMKRSRRQAPLTIPRLEKLLPPSHNGTQLTIHQSHGQDMPTLFRFLVTLAVIAGVIYGAMYALVMLVEPRTGEMTVRIPAERLNPPQ